MTYRRHRRCWVLTYLIWHGWGLIWFDIICLVVEFQPLWKIWKSVGMMTFPIYGKIKKCSKPPTSNGFHNVSHDGTGRSIMIYHPLRNGAEVVKLRRLIRSVYLQDISWSIGTLAWWGWIWVKSLSAPITGWFILPSGYLTSPWKDPPFLRTVNHLFLWAIDTMAMLVITKG